jgi:ribosomal 30S subunit maturation factor RimM
MQTRIDHLAIGASSLAQGVAYIKDLLGLDIPFGGVHSKMGTHNHLMQLGAHMFLEVIAINVDSEPPQKPRWFGFR